MPPAPPVTVSPAAGGEAEWCAHLMAASEPWITLGRGLENCRKACRHPDYLLLIARDIEPCGFVLLHPRGVAGSPYIASIAVAPEHRGKGIGSLLLDHAESSFPGAHHIFLCVSSFNARARKLYQRRGYTPVGELPDYVVPGASEILMYKRLAP